MQEAYISLTLMPENKLASLLTKCKLPTIISKVIYFTHKNRLRKNSNLSDFNYTDLYDLATEPVQESRDPTITIEKIKKEHPAHFEFIKECLAIKNKTGAQRAELFRTRNILKKTYNGTRID